MEILGFKIERKNKGAGKSVWPSYVGEPHAKVRPPKWDYEGLYKEADENWVVQAPVQFLIAEAMRVGGGLQFRYKSRCEKCGMEYQKEVDTCEICGSTDIVKPNPMQMRVARNLTRKPNGNGETWNQILYSLFYHDAVADIYYTSIAYEHKEDEQGNPRSFIPREIYVEDPRWIRTVYDERLRLGDAPYICKHHYDPEDEDSPQSDTPANCPICGLPMEKTAYVQQVNDDIKNRFTASEMKHSSTYRVLPDPDGKPRLASAWRSIHTVKAIDEWFYDTYETGSLEFILLFPESKGKNLKEFQAAVKAQMNMLEKIDIVSGEGRASKLGKHIWLTKVPGEDVQQVHLMMDPTKMRVIEHYMTLISGIMSVWGIQATFVNTVTQGGASNPAVKMEIQNHKIEQIHRNMEDFINDKLFPVFGITDVVWRFNPLKKKDKVQESKVQQQQSATLVNISRTPGVTAEIDETGTMTIYGKVVGKEQPVSNPQTRGDSHQGYRESDSTGQLINETTRERDTTMPTMEDNRVEENADV